MNTKYRIRLAVVLLIIQWSFKRFHFRYRDLKVCTEVAFLTWRGREFQMSAPEFMNDFRKSSQLGFGVYSWLQLVDLVSGHMLLIILHFKNAFWFVTLSGNVCQLSSLNRSEDSV